MTLTRAKIVVRVCEKVGLSRDDAINVVEAMFDIIKAALERGEQVKIMNFGIFSLRAKNPRRGRNPKSGADILIAGRKVVTFKASDEMKKSVNSGSASA
jgi:integration host factor subunit alpha